MKLQDDKDLESFIISNCGTWCFDDIVNKFNNNPNVFVMFSLEFDPIATNFADGLNNRYYLSENAKFLQRNDFRGEEKDRFYFKVEPEEILNVKNEIENKIKAILHDNGKQWSDFCYHIIITLHKNKNPIHIKSYSYDEATGMYLFTYSDKYVRHQELKKGKNLNL